MSALLFSRFSDPNSVNGERSPPRIEAKVNVESKDLPALSVKQDRPSKIVFTAKKPRIERKRTIYPKIEKLKDLREQMSQQMHRREAAAAKLASGRRKYYLFHHHEPPKDWRHRLYKFLHTRSFELFLTCALILDIIIVIVDLFLEGMCILMNSFLKQIPCMFMVAGI